MTKPVIIGICGGSGAGKSTLAQRVLTHFGEDKVSVIQQDWYYRDLSNLPRGIAEQTNFDHPDSIETDHLVQDVAALRQGCQVDAPQYDFSTFSRKQNTLQLKSHPIIIVEGLFVILIPELRELLDQSVFVDVPNQVRFTRRIERDQRERGYELSQIEDFWKKRAEPMYKQFVEPQKKLASKVWKSLEDNTFVPEFLADLESRLARNADEPTTR